MIPWPDRVDETAHLRTCTMTYDPGVYQDRATPCLTPKGRLGALYILL